MKRALCALSAVSVMLVLALCSASAQNLFTNGDFEQGNTGFASDYAYIPGDGTHHTEPSQYSVITNPSTAFTNGYLSYGDHTTGSGLMFFADGGPSTQNVWTENLSLAAGMYTFTAWVADPDPNLGNAEMLGLYINGQKTGNTFTSTQVGQWQEWTMSVNVANPGAASFAIRNLNPNYQSGNDDFTLDDLTLTPEPSSLLLLGSGLVGCIGVIRRRMAKS